MARLPRTRAQAKEQWPGPTRSGDQTRDLGERAVALAVVDNPLLEHGDLMSRSVPLADEQSPGRHLTSRSNLLAPAARPVFGAALEQPAGRRVQAAESSLLQAVGDRPGEQPAADSGWRFGVVQIAPANLELVHAEARKRPDLSGDLLGPLARRLIFHVQSGLSPGSHTHRSFPPHAASHRPPNREILRQEMTQPQEDLDRQPTACSILATPEFKSI